MELEQFVNRHAKAIEEFNRHENRDDGGYVASSLAGGLNVLSDSMYARLYTDVEKMIGRDSMLMPISELKTRMASKNEIELYQIAESAAVARDCGYTGGDAEWYAQWLAQLRLGESEHAAADSSRLSQYLSETPDDRRLTFTDVLAEVLPQSRRAPLVVFRLLPLSVQITTALAFADQAGASKARNLQTRTLPSISDCHQCRGRVLENGDQCPVCGNPLWKPDWLTETG